MPHWKNYEFEHYEPKNLGDIVQKLDEVGLDLLKVLIESYLENVAAKSI